MFSYKKVIIGGVDFYLCPRTAQGVQAAARANAAYSELLDADYFDVMPAPEYNRLAQTLEINALQACRCGAEDMLNPGISDRLEFVQRYLEGR